MQFKLEPKVVALKQFATAYLTKTKIFIPNKTAMPVLEQLVRVQRVQRGLRNGVHAQEQDLHVRVPGIPRVPGFRDGLLPVRGHC